MKTQNIIQAVANVIKVTSLKKGDVVKMIETSTYSNPESSYSVVLDLLSDGENTYVEFLKYKKTYDSISAEIKLYKGSDDISLFPASPEELENHFREAVYAIEKSIKEDQDKLQKKIDGLNKAKEFISGELSKTLTEVEFLEMTQEKYLESKKEKEEKIKALSAS